MEGKLRDAADIHADIRQACMSCAGGFGVGKDGKIACGLETPFPCILLDLARAVEVGDAQLQTAATREAIFERKRALGEPYQTLQQIFLPQPEPIEYGEGLITPELPVTLEEIADVEVITPEKVIKKSDKRA